MLAICLYMTKQSDTAQHETDASALTDLSNQLTSAQSQLTTRDGTILTLSNSLTESQSAVSTFSNQLTDAKSATTLDAEQITGLKTKVAESTASNQALGQQVTQLTNQVNTLSQQLDTTKASLFETNSVLVQSSKDYLLLENRFRINVAERVAMQRKFNNRTELTEQLKRLKEYPPGEVSAEKIYSGLDVEVKSNGTFHVIAPN